MRVSVILLTALVLFSCQSAPESAEAIQEETATEASTTAANSATSARPDPENPSGENNAVPEDWMVRLDRPNPDAVIGADSDSSDIFFVNMTPGWHITSGPSAIYYHPASTAEGTYMASIDVHLFDPGERNEAFGLIMGGENLDAPDQAYDYFLIRNSGEYLIKRRRGDQTEVIKDWTPHESINTYTAESESSVLNNLAVNVSGDMVDFMINGEIVNSFPLADIKTNGLFGLRINHALNLHVSDISVESQEG